MARITSLWRNLLRRDRIERDLDDELRAMFEALVDEKIRAGLKPEAARRAARLELGAVESIKEQVRDARAGAVVDHVRRDLRYALRTLVKSPGISLVMVMTFALGSGAVTAMFTLVNGILLQPLPYADSDRLVAIKHAAPGIGLAETGLSSGTYFHYRAHADSLETIAVFQETVLNLSTPETGTERVEVTLAGPELFELLGVRPVLGRVFTAKDGEPGFMNMTWPVPVLLSQELWTGRYRADPGIVGSTIMLNNRARHVMGILPAGFGFPRPETQIWMLFMPTEATARFAGQFNYSAVARLRPGVSAAAAAAELVGILPSIQGKCADATASRLAEAQLIPLVVPMKEEIVGGVRTFLWLLFGGVTVVLLVASANVANMSVLRAEQRHREIAVRSALGARRADLVRLFVTEAALVSAAGAALGLLLARVAVSVLIAVTPVRLPRLADVEFDAWVVAFTAGVSMLAALLFGALAFLRQSVNASAVLKASAGLTDNRGRVRARRVLVTAQVAFALTLLAGSALMIESFWRLARVDPGFDPSGLVTIETGLPGNRASEHQRIYGALLERVRALPGVRSAAAASSLPLDGTPYAYPMAIGVPPRTSEEPVAMKFVMPGYFQAMRTAVVDGAGFALDDTIGPNAVVVSAALARRFFPGQNPIGRNVQRLDSGGRPVDMFDRATRTFRAVPPWTVVGVVADVREQSLRLDPAEIVYVPVRNPAVERSIVPTSMTLVIRSDGPPASLAAAVRSAIREIEPTLSIARIRTMDSIVASSIARERFLAALLLVAAAVSLFLGAIGVHGVAAHAVRRREQEIGIRVALGARPGQLVRMMLAESVALVLIGAALGLVIALAATRVLRAFLFEVSATDPMLLAMVTAVLIAAALMASLLPARRAVRLDPVAALRSE
ncbi:MAG: ADOP family duplicated permease [Vicinamibacterales bacterium]